MDRLLTEEDRENIAESLGNDLNCERARIVELVMQGDYERAGYHCEIAERISATLRKLTPSEFRYE